MTKLIGPHIDKRLAKKSHDVWARPSAPGAQNWRARNRNPRRQRMDKINLSPRRRLQRRHSGFIRDRTGPWLTEC